MFEYHYSLQNVRKSVPCKQKTKQFCILLDGDPYITVKLHDTIHYVVIKVAKGHMFCFKGGVEVEECLKMKELLQNGLR